MINREPGCSCDPELIGSYSRCPIHSLDKYEGESMLEQLKLGPTELTPMKAYTIGALFSHDFTEVLLINKLKPKWQAGKLNFPGGSIEEGEDSFQCVSREFEEETNFSIPPNEWHFIGKIENKRNYYVDFLTAVIPNGSSWIGMSLTDEKITWEHVDQLPRNCISNLFWLVPFALNYWEQGNVDNIKFGLFTYQNQ